MFQITNFCKLVLTWTSAQFSENKKRVDENHNVFKMDEVVRRVLSLSLDPERVRKDTSISP